MKTLIATLMLLFAVVMPASAESLPAPEGPVILTVSGNIENTQDGEAARFDLEQLKQIDSKLLDVQTRWTDEAHEYYGPRLLALLKQVGATGQTVRMIALNDYAIDVDLAYIEKYDPILAWRDNGQVMRVRDKGPLWVILPVDQYPYLNEGDHSAKMIWQLTAIEIR